MFKILKYIFSYYFYAKLIKKSLKKRKGKCRVCGKCCRHLLGTKINCPFLRGNLCIIHRRKKHIPIIRIFCPYLPVEWWGRKNCGYYWEKEK